MGWIACHTAGKNLKAAFEDCWYTLEWGLGLSKEYEPAMSEDLRFFIADYRIKGRRLTLLIQNPKHPDHREIACFLIDLDRKNSEFFYKQVGFADGFSEDFPMMKTWAKELLAKQGNCNAGDEWVRGRFSEFSRYLSDAYMKTSKSGGI